MTTLKEPRLYSTVLNIDASSCGSSKLLRFRPSESLHKRLATVSYVVLESLAYKNIIGP